MFKCGKYSCKIQTNIFSQGNYRKCEIGLIRTNCTKSTSINEVKTMNLDDLPGPRRYPVVGTLYKYLPFVGDYDAEALDKNAWLNYRRYGDLVLEYPGVRLLHIFDPDDMAAVFRQDDRYPSRRSHVAMLNYRLQKTTVYNTGGLLATNGPEWWRLRSSFQKNFTGPQSAKVHVESTDNIIRELVQSINENFSDGDDFLIYLNRLNLEIIGEVAFSERFRSFSHEEQNPESRSSKTIAAAFGSNSGIMKLDKGFLWKFFATPLYQKLVKSQEYLEKVASDILLDRVNFFETEDNKEDYSLLRSFLQQPNVDLKDVLSMMVDILMAAIDTTAYATSFALYHLSRNPDCQKKLFEETISLLPSKVSSITPDVLSQAVYLRNCIKESLRLNPVSIGVGRLLQKDITLKGYSIPAGTVVVTQNMVSSRLPQYVRDPLVFKPTRWLRGSPDYENIHPFLSLPFGFGPRSCIARRLAEQNMCITLMRLIREFELKWIGEELGIRTLLINKPDKSVSLSFSPRNI